MLKKLLLVLVIFVLVIGGLQLFGGRDFRQINVALDKYSSHGELGTFLGDVVTIFKGEKVRESALPSSRYEDMVMYRWIDQYGEVQFTERKPESGEFTQVRLGDMNFDIQKGMSREEIEQILKLKEKE